MDLLQVKALTFGVYSPDHIHSTSVVEITEVGLYKNSVPRKGGRNDLRMGTVERGFRCATCKKRSIDCPGHFGHIDFHRPVINPNKIRVVFKVLRCVCYWCSSLIIPASKRPGLECNHRKRKILAVMSNMGKTISTCPECRGPQPEYKRKVYEITHRFSQPDDAFESPEEVAEARRPLDAARIRRILRNISDDDVRALGLCPVRSRPEWLVWTCMLVPPPCMRPSVLVSAGTQSRGEDF